MITKVDREYLKEIISLEKKIFGDEAYKTTMLEKMFDDERYSFIMDSEKKSYLILYDAVDSYEIIRIGVLKEERGKGLGKKLLNFLFSHSDKEIFLEVRETNGVAINLYQQTGFKEIARRKNYYSNGETAVIMKLENGK